MILTLSFSTFILIIVAYGIGSVPFGLIFTRLSGRGDIRDIGSGNIGATNVLRTGSRKLAVLTLVFDAGKGAVAVGVANHFADIHIAALAGLLTVIGHCFLTRDLGRPGPSARVTQDSGRGEYGGGSSA